MKNLFTGNGSTPKQFCVYAKPSDLMAFHNIQVMGHLSSVLEELNTASTQNNLMFIPNPDYKSDVTPYHNNIARKLRTEYNFEQHRPPFYPSRTQALFLFDSEKSAEVYKLIHPDHIKDRLLVHGVTEGDYIYSIHDSGWFDFLCQNAGFDDHTINNNLSAYWAGINVNQCELQLYGHPWTQAPTHEVLFYGRLKILEESRKEFLLGAQQAFIKNPRAFPAGIQLLP
jgi:hypothetical protein